MKDQENAEDLVSSQTAFLAGPILTHHIAGRSKFAAGPVVPAGVDLARIMRDF
jgi:hypothetical protein